MCTAREKLKRCKNVVKKAHPMVLQFCNPGPGTAAEFMADYWCNETNGFFLYRDYFKCTYVANVIPVDKDFSPDLNIHFSRGGLAIHILVSADVAGLSAWHRNHDYSNPDDAVYQAISRKIYMITKPHDPTILA